MSIISQARKIFGPTQSQAPEKPAPDANVLQVVEEGSRLNAKVEETEAYLKELKKEYKKTEVTLIQWIKQGTLDDNRVELVEEETRASVSWRKKSEELAAKYLFSGDSAAAKNWAESVVMEQPYGTKIYLKFHQT